MTRLRGSALAALFALVPACNEPGGAPQLADSGNGWDPFRDLVHLGWTHPRGEVSGGYVLERRVAPQPFGAVQSVSARATTLDYNFEPGALDLTDFEFRLRALPDEDGTRASNVITVYRGLHHPNLTCVRTTDPVFCALVNGGFQLSWSDVSPVVDALLLERIVNPGPFSGGTSTRTTLPVTLQDSSYFDPDVAAWVNGAQVSYYLTVMSSSARSHPVLVFSGSAPYR